MSPTVVNTWSASYSRPSGYSIPTPVNQTISALVPNTGNPGNWLIAVVAWRQPQAAPSAPVTFAVGDDQGNVWEPLGAPNGTSSAAGVTRVSVWACPNVSKVSAVDASPNGNYLSAGMLVMEVSGLSSWITPGSLATIFALASTGSGSVTSVPPTGAPLNQNSLFTSAAAPWTAANSVIAASPAWGYQTPGALAITPAGVSPGAKSEMVPVTAGTTYTLSYWALATQAWNGAQAVINWYNSSGTFLSATTGTAVAVTAGRFAYVFASAAAPAGAAFAAAVVQWTGSPGASVVLYASQVTIGPASPALFLTVCAGDLTTGGVTAPSGAGWTTLPQVTATNGTDHTTDIVLTAGWQVASAAQTASFTGSATQDLAALAGCVLVQGIPPVAPQQGWPLTRVQLGLGAGAQTPWDQIGFTEVTPRYRGMSGSRGKQYELDVIQAGTHNWTLSNNDGDLTPGNPLSAYYPFVQVYTPVRLLVTWPPPPAAVAKTYSVVRHFMERWPQARTQTRFQNANAVSTDAWALLTPEQVTIARSEMLLDSPTHLWPLDDPAGTTAARNIAPTGGGQLQVVQSKYGPGTAVQAFQSGSGFLPGDPSGSNWELSVVPATDNEGYTLYYAGSDLPAIAGGVTIDGWFEMATSQPTGVNLALISVRNAKGNVWQLYVQQSTGHILLDVWDRTTNTKTTTGISTGLNWITQNAYFHAMVAFTPTTWSVWINGGSFGAVTGTSNFASSPWWVSFDGTADLLGASQFFNGNVGLAGVYPLALLQNRAVAHYWSALTGIQNEDGPATRMERLMGASQCAFPRTMGFAGYAMQGAVDIAQQAVSQNVTNIAESDNGLLLVNGAGYIRYSSRADLWNLPVLWTFGEDVAAPLNQNSDFETGVAPWTAQNGATLTQSSAWSPTGQFSALLTPNGSTAAPGMLCENIPVTPGVSYTASGWLYSPQGWAAGVTVSVAWHAAGGSLISTTASTTTVLTAGQPVMLTATGRAPDGAAYGVMVIAAAGTPGSGVQFFTDDAVITTTATEYSYLPDFATDYDPSQVFNDVELDQEQAVEVVGQTATGVTITLASAASIAQYGDQTLQETIYTYPTQGIVDLANWIVNTMGAPQTRIANMTLDPSANPALWPVVLSLETGQVIWVNSRLGGTQVDVSGPFQVMTVGHANAPGSWLTTVTAIPYYGNVLTTDDPVNGVLTGAPNGPRLAW
jgi:hypothetical protein